MPEGVPIEFTGLTKRFGEVEAVSGFTATVPPGRVTGFLGPNGAGKTTTLRMLLGLVAPTAGRATIGGVPYRRLDRPFSAVGAALEAASFHPGRTARDHLRVYAQAARVEPRRVDAALDAVGLTSYARRRVGGYSLGMRQRLGLASALLGDPGVLILDEPINGLDPEGIKWIRTFLRELAAEGRTVLVSSHLLSEVQQTVDDVLIIAKGRLVHTGPLSGLQAQPAVRVLADSPDRSALRSALQRGGLEVEETADGLVVTGAERGRVGHVAFAAGVELSLLTQQRPAAGLEDAFLALVGEEGAL
ncbi:ABC transporter ATP-binding protein [Naasia sp. SYSU D00948]|uniref:ABC transporter ATP-binding protein n=1 Tax=Naasia sp. SYSU D00948 TaxID=2817379 RepID=UPI001B3079C6|nr:ATP-binding cassette domain-containing protein [Naasia sp. SYSU D00948]